MVKEYKIFKTASKTAKENNLVFKDKENIFDFSLLDSMEISDREKECIKEHDIRYVSAAFKESFYGADFDDFSACIGKSLYHVQKVFSEATEHNTQERTCMYDEYTATTYRESNGYSEPTFDIEMA